MAEYTPEAPLTDRLALDKAVGGYEPKGFPDPLPNIPYTSLDMSLPNLPSTITKVDGEPTPMAISAIENSILAARNGDGRQFGGSIPRSIAEVTSSRYDNFIPGDYNNEDAYAQGQGWTSKMVNDVGKGLALTAGTFLQGTLGVINGLARWGQDGRFASFYDNPENRAIDNAYKKLEDILPNYYKDVEKNAAWYSPTKLLSANFLWDGIVKNMGFAAGAALTGNVYAAGVKALAALPGLSRLVSVGKAAEVVAAGEEALLAANQPAALLGKIRGLSDKFLGQYKFLSPAGRTVVAGLSTTGEAGFEAFQNLNKFRDDKILEWKESHNGLEPMGADLDAINREADSVGNSSMALNIGLLTATNYIQFPKILGSSYKAEKGIISSLTREIDDLAKDAAGNLVSKEAVKEAARGFGGRLFSASKKFLPFTKESYTFSPSEAFEEGAQYVIGQASNDYYNKKYKGEATDFLASLSQGLGDITSNEGMENVLIGGLSGAMMQVRDTYSTNKQRVKDTATALELMNKWKFSSFTKDTIAAVDRGTVIQQEREAHLRQGDILMSKESERDYIINYLTPRIKYGRFDLVKADIDEYRALASTPDGFNQLVQEGKVVEGDTQPAYLQRINNLETTANNIKSTYQSLNLRYGGLLAEDGKSPLYRDEVIDKMIYAATKVADYDERIPELSSSLISKGIGVDIDSVINDVNAGNEESYNEAVAQIEELEKTSKINADQKLDLLRDLNDVAEMTTRRKKMLQEYSDMKNSPEKYETIPVKPESIAKKGVKAISIKTKDGDLEFEIGKEYYGDGPMKKSKEGIYYKDFTRFTVVGETESGKLILKTISNDPNVDGKVIEVDKSYFAKHQIKEFSALNKRPNEKFYVESAHFTFDYKTGGGKTVPGTIRYDRKTDKLTFVSADGKTKKTITRGDFTARKDYKEAKIVPRGKLTAKAQAALNEPLSEEEIKARIDTRNTIIAEAMTTLKEELVVVDEKIAKVKDNLAETKKKIDELAFTKDGKPRKSYVGAAGKLLRSLTADYKAIEDTIDSLENEKEELDNTINYFQEAYDNKDSLPDTYNEIVKSLKNEIGEIKELSDITSSSIKTGKGLLEGIKELITSLINSLGKSMTDIKQRNPKTSAFIDDFQLKLEKYLGEEGALSYIENRLELTELLTDLKEAIVAAGETVRVPTMEIEKAAKLLDQITELEKGLSELSGQQKLKEKVLSAFSVVIDEYESKLEEEEALTKSEEAKKEFLKTAELGNPTEVITEEGYEQSPKKNDIQVVTSTIAATEKYNVNDQGNAMPLADHHVRANAFGFRMNSFPNRKNLFGVYVTSKNENEFLPGLTQYLKDNGNLQIEVDPLKTIVMVMVEVDPMTGNKVVVGVDGKPLDPSLSNEEKLNQAVYQVKPIPKEGKKGEAELTWSKGESMFREGTPKEVVTSLTEQYALWREETLANPSSAAIDINPSFGIPEIETGGIASVESAGLMSNNGLKDRAIEVPTLEGIVDGYKNPIGKPFLIVGENHVPLRNRKLTKTEAETIYEVIRQLSIELLNNKNLQSDEAKRLLEYLRSVVYWGEPKEGKESQNSVFFRDVPSDGITNILKLFIKGEEQDIAFVPSAIKAKKDVIIALLQDTYNQVNARLTSGEWNESYEEILSVADDGTITKRDWPNYQSYLLSSRIPNENGDLTGDLRETVGSVLPLFTNIRPMENADDVNRKGIYFTEVSQERFVRPEIKAKKLERSKKAKKAKTGIKKVVTKAGEKKVITLGGKKRITPEGKISVIPLGKFKLDGIAVNQIKTKPTDPKQQPKTIFFRASKELLLKGDKKNGIKILFKDENGLPIGDAIAIQDTLMENNKFSKEGSVEQLKIAIYLQIQQALTKKAEFVPKKQKGPLDINQTVTLGKVPLEEEEEEAEEDIEEEIIEIGGTKGEEAAEETVEDDGFDEDWKKDRANLEKNKKKGVVDEEEEPPFRRIIEDEIDNFEGENWTKLSKWLASVFPNVPVYRLKNVIKATNGQYAFGMFKAGAIYIYENAEVGTAYHEVFHAVWGMFTDIDEREAIMSEFRKRKGTFFDRKSLKNINYSEATDIQLEERLAEEFRDYVHEGKIPAKPTQGRPWILRAFAELSNLIKQLFTKEGAQVNAANLFDKISSGYYKQYSPYTSGLAFAEKGIIDVEDAYSDDSSRHSIATFTSQEVHEIMQEMTYRTVGEIVSTNKGLFSITDVNKSELYGETLRDKIRTLADKRIIGAIEIIDDETTPIEKRRDAERLKTYALAMRASIRNDEIWDSLVELHAEHLNKFGIEFDENDNIELNDENKSKDSSFDGSKIDNFRKANAAIKLLLSTLPLVEASETSPTKTKHVQSSIGGVILLPGGEMFIKTMNSVHNSRNIDEMLLRIKNLAVKDLSYRALYSRMTKRSYDKPGVNLDKLTEQHDLDLLNSFWTAFKKQAPDVRNHFILENGEIQIGEANLSTAARQIKSEMVNAFVKILRKKNPYFKRVVSEKAYVAIPKSVENYTLNNNVERIKFLATLGIKFKLKDVNSLNLKKARLFKEGTAGIRKSIADADKVATLSGKVLNINKRLLQLAEVKAYIENPQFDSTYFGGSGERKHTYIGTNAASDLYDCLSQIDNLNDIPSLYPQYSYLLTDSFVKGSVILNKMFDLSEGGDGRRILSLEEELLHPGIVDSTIDVEEGFSKESAKLTYKQRFLQELNLNIDGYYLNLVPADSSLEHKMLMGNHITNKDLRSGFEKVHTIFKGYFMSELELARETERIVAKGRNSKELRFFKGIFDATDKTLHKDVLASKKSVDKVYEDFEKRINDAVTEFILQESKKTKDALIKFDLIEKSGEKTWDVKNLNFEEANKQMVPTQALDRQINGLTINYMINNIELHKLLYSDPYQYADELKRIKNFLSPRTALMSNSPMMNSMLNSVWNKFYPNKKDIAKTDFGRDYMKSISYNDVTSSLGLKGYEGGWKETDGGGTIIYKAYRNFRIRVGNWNPSEERQFKYDIAWEKVHKGKGLSDKDKAKKGLVLSEEEQEIYDKGNPHVKSAYTPIKPIVSGNKGNGKSYNDVVLDKFALYPLSYRIIHEINPEANALNLYDKMQKEDIDYAIFNSGRKVGVEQPNDFYDESTGKLNDKKYTGVTKIPFAIMSVQSEVPSKDNNLVTRGSQMTKLLTMDFMEAGVPIDFEADNKDINDRYAKWITLEDKFSYNEGVNLYTEIKNNENLLKHLIVDGYNTLLETLGLEEVDNGWKIADIKKVISTLRAEFLKRDINDNVISALAGYENNDVVIEATPAYQQIRNILYSIVDSEVISQKITGGQKVQIASTGFESVRRINSTEKGFESDVLKFYVDEDGQRVCEIMVGRWFKSDLSDEALLEYLNTTDDGKRILSGLGFRTPTQKQNSIDVFKIAKFLPREFGDSVVVPSAIVNKTGSDFDIDKISLYLKNVFVNKEGYPKIIEFLTDKNSTIDERYRNFVRSKVKDYADIKKDVKENSVEYQKLQKELDDIYQSYKEKLQETKDETINVYSEKLAEIRAKIEAGKDASQDIFEQGFDIFRELPISIRQQFMDRNAALDKLVDAGTIQSFDKTLYFKKFAIQWKAALEESPDFEIGYRNTKTGTNETQLVSSASVIKTIDKLTSNYDFYLTSIGWTKETIEEFNKNVAKLKEGVDSYKGLKEEIKVSDLVSPNKNTIAEFDALFNKTLAETFGVMPKEEFEKLSMYEQNTKKANQNEYIESSERLASNRLNFSNLILPNSAKKLQDLSIEIVNATGQTVFNYSDPTNMLDRNFMSNLRHSFITGKYAIGIAAVNQTNHSLNQRQPIFIDLSKLENIDPKDKMWIGDAKLKFFNEDGEQNFNTIMINGVEVVTQSMVLTRSGDYISDIISQFIDGYVDIAKDPWIMQLGATPNVAGTWLFLIKSGVPIDQVAYFMNQPIIRDYLRTLENAGYTWLFNDKMAVEVMSGYEIGKESIEITSIPTNLKDTLGKETFSPKENAEQRFILTEFLKYAKIAQHLFYVTQGSNFDTANFNDPTLVFKKEMQLTKAQNSIFSSVDDKNSVVSAVDAILNNSFLQVLRVYIGKSKNALAEILISDKKRVRSIIQTALMPYVDLPDREFVKIAQKMTNDFFDWAVQTIPKTKKGATLNSLIEDALIKDDSYVEQLSEFVEGIRSNPKHALYNNQVIKVLEPIFSDRVGDKLVNNIKIKNKESNVYDQNQIIYAFKELKTYLSSSRTGLYKKLVTVAVLQSGLSTSPISFTSLLPYEDFKDEYNLILSKLETLPNLEVFNTLDVFSRNNWSNDDIVPRMKARLIEGQEENYYNPAMNFLPTNVKNAVNKEEIPPVISVSIGSKEANYEIIVYQWEDESFSLNERRTMRERGDFSYIKKGLFKKVKDVSGSPLVYESGSIDNPFVNYVYQAINAWGDSYRANEFYNKGQQSVIETNFIKVEEVDPSKILPYFVNRGYLLTSEGKLPNTAVKETSAQTIPIQKATKTSPAPTVVSGKVMKPKGRPAIKNRNQNSCGS